jgi:pectinesterase
MHADALGHGFVAQNLTILNSAGPDGKQAVALRSNSHRSVVYGCSIEGYEDTLYAENGAQVYLDTDIYGTVDFVFGNARAVFQRCRIRVREPLSGKHNVITAQGCNNKTYQDSGFVFHRCTVEADPNPIRDPVSGEPIGFQNLTGVETYLGRPHRNFSHVVFMQSELGAIVHTDGWVAWDKNHVVKETTESVKYLEFNNTGAGADTARRVNWTGVQVIHDAAQVTKYCIDNFVAGKEWIPQQIPYDHEIPRGIVV